MKKIILTLALAGMVLGASAQEKGRFEVMTSATSNCMSITRTTRWAMPATLWKARRLSLRWNSRSSKTM